MRWNLAVHMPWPWAIFDPLLFKLFYSFLNGCVIGHSVHNIIRNHKKLRELKRVTKEMNKYPMLLYITGGHMWWLPTAEECVDELTQPGLAAREIPRNWWIPREMWHDYHG